VISTQLQAGRLSIKIYSTGNPSNGFEQVHADLEDVYFSTLQKVH
jgi:ABC-2 type transport system ATP-binding protein